MSAARRFIAVLLLLLSVGAMAEPVYKFDTAAQRARFTSLTNGLRCLVCQGESIADSNADLAQDMRDKVHELVLAGKSSQAVRGYMTARYGDFVLFRPPMKPKTLLLWAGPGVLAVAAVVGVLLAARRRRSQAAKAGLSSAERQRLEASLSRHDAGRRG